MTKMKWLGLFLLFFLSMSAFAQQPQWMIKNYSEVTSKLVDFRSGTSINPNPMDFGIDDNEWLYNFKEGHNAIYNHDGELEIFISNNLVFRPTGEEWYWMLDQSWNTFEDASDPYYLYDQEVVTVKVPGDCDRYYIFRYSYDHDKRNYLHYYIYDVALHAFIDPFTGDVVGDGDEVLRGKKIFHSKVPKHIVNHTRNITVSKMNEAGERFLIFESMPDFTFSTGPMVVHTATITGSGVSYDGALYTTPYNTVGKVHETEVVKTTEGNYLYATCTYEIGIDYEFSKGIILTLDANGNLINQETFTTDGKIKGMEFSPNGQFLYFTKTAAPYLQYVDAVSPTTVYNLNPTGTIVDKASYHISSLEVAYDGKLYYAGENGISSLADPNDPTSLWVNNDIAIPVKEFTRGFPYHISHRLIPLPAQVDGELMYAPLTFPGSVSAGCDGTFDEICLEAYEGYEYYWFKGTSELAIGYGPCFTPTSSGSYTIKVIDENGCVKQHSFFALFSMVLLPVIDDVTMCDMMPAYVGWDSNPLASYPCFYTIHWYYNGDHYPAYNTDYQIPYLGNGEYCAKVIFADGSTQTKCFDVNICSSPNPNFDAVLDLTNNPFEIVVTNNPLYTPDYEFEMFVLLKDCDGDNVPGPWEYVETITRTSDFDTPVVFDIEIPNCLYKIVHNVNNMCCPMSYTHTEYVGWIFGLATENNNGVKQIASLQEVSVYPNPSNGVFTIDIDKRGAKVTVVNLLGQEVYSANLGDDITHKIDLGNREGGVYIIHIEVEGERVVKKLLLNREDVNE